MCKSNILSDDSFLVLFKAKNLNVFTMWRRTGWREPGRIGAGGGRETGADGAGLNFMELNFIVSHESNRRYFSAF